MAQASEKENVDDESLYEKVYLSKKSQELNRSIEPMSNHCQELKKTVFKNKSLQQLLVPNKNKSAQTNADNSIQTLKESINNFKMKFSRTPPLKEKKTTGIEQEREQVDEPIIHNQTISMSSTLNHSEASVFEQSEIEEKQLLQDEKHSYEK
jgi:hypothetical protein